MQPYDTTFKRLLRQSVTEAMRELTGTTIIRWHNVELPDTSRVTLDLLGETADGELIHIELQSTNDPKMPLRMAEYYLRVGRLFGRFPRQILLYVGNGRLRMKAALQTASLSYSYRVVDIRNLDGARLLASSEIGDNILAVLTNVPNLRETIRRVLGRIAELSAGERKLALDELAMLAGLRQFGHMIKEETEAMPILDDIMDHDLYGPLIRRTERRTELRTERKVIRRLLTARFGAIPEWVEGRLESLKAKELVDLSIRILNAQSLAELLPPTPPRRSRPAPRS